jgi:predicted ester cyclase
MRKSSFLLLLLAVCVPVKGQETRVQERNKEVARSFFEAVLGQGHLDKYAESHAKDFVAHGENQEYTLEEDMAAAKEERKALPDMKVEVNQILAERDLVAVYWTASGHQHPGRNGFSGNGQEDQN